ncbi:MAG TPA: glycosyltransferase family 39 protein [Chitinophagaceae bacterium]|nr:glycosyltransferase family 39 protein [Chitinophagaceae bacterium]
MDQTSNRWLLFLIGLAVLVNLSGIFNPLMEPDACVYAIVSKNMVLRNDWAGLYFNGADWLDKPHFPFWITAAFFRIFGIHTWSYKLPAILFVFLAARYTWLLAKQLYNERIALWAVLILLTAEHIILTNNDVRAEPYLTALIIAAIYHFRNALGKERVFFHLVIASFFTACAFMTKGLFTLIPIAGAIAGELIIKQKWKLFISWKWLVALVLIALFITPELYCLWLQFDSHPEKTIFGRTGVSGIRFFLWDGQFGRFTNTGPYKGEGSPIFFLHTLLWAFLPWSILMYGSLVNKIGKLADPTLREKEEWFNFYAAIFTLFVFSISSFQLPHYTNIIFPMLAILVAKYMEDLKGRAEVIFKVIQNSIAIILFLAIILLQVFYSPHLPSLFLIFLIAFFIVLLIKAGSWFSVKGYRLAIFRSVLAIMIFNLYLNWFFYPDLLKYQSGSEAAFYINKNFPGSPVIKPSIYSPAFEFYFKGEVQKNVKDSIAPGMVFLLTEQELVGLSAITRKLDSYKEFPEFHVTTLNMKFINKKTRHLELKKYYLVRATH